EIRASHELACEANEQQGRRTLRRSHVRFTVCTRDAAFPLAGACPRAGKEVFHARSHRRSRVPRHHHLPGLVHRLGLPRVPRGTLPPALSDLGGADDGAVGQASRTVKTRWGPGTRAHGSQLLWSALACVLTLGCDKNPTGRETGPTRSFRMGFSAIPPSSNQATLLASLAMWGERADAGSLDVGVQWGAMLAGSSATVAARANALDLSNYYRAHNLP